MKVFENLKNPTGIDLQTSWHNLRAAEKKFLSCKNKNLSEGLKIEFKKRHTKFDEVTHCETQV